MRLSDYLHKTGQTLTEFGERIGVTHVSVHRYLHKGRIPKRETMERIVAATGGEVTPGDFYGLPSASTLAPDNRSTRGDF